MKSLLGAAVLAGAFGAAPARAETIEFAVWYSERDFYADFIRDWAAEVGKRTQGRVNVKLHFSGALTSAKETVAAVRTGAVGGGTTSVSFVTGIVKETSYMEPIFWIPDNPDVATRTVQQITPKIAERLRTHNLELMFMMPSAGVIAACVNDHVKDPADWKGRKVRAAGRWQGVQMRLLGATAVAIDPGEVYIALQNKTVDCTLFLANLALSGKIHEVAPNITYFREGVNSSLYFVNADAWKKISPEDRKVIGEISQETVAKTAPKQVEQQEAAIQQLEKAGAKVYRATDAQIAATKKAVAPVWDQVRTFVGPSGDEIRDILMKNW
jgi:TRAP-type C4-dicarboxylate transport system substrate-binding protein